MIQLSFYHIMPIMLLIEIRCKYSIATSFPVLLHCFLPFSSCLQETCLSASRNSIKILYAHHAPLVWGSLMLCVMWCSVDGKKIMWRLSIGGCFLFPFLCCIFSKKTCTALQEWIMRNCAMHLPSHLHVSSWRFLQLLPQPAKFPLWKPFKGGCDAKEHIFILASWMNVFSVDTYQLAGHWCVWFFHTCPPVPTWLPRSIIPWMPDWSASSALK